MKFKINNDSVRTGLNYFSNGIDKSCFTKKGFMVLSFLIIPLMLNAQQTYTGADGVEVTVKDASRIVSIGPAVTEILFELGVDNQVIAVDESSSYPEETQTKQKVSYTRNLSAEGILSTSPSLILASAASGPKTAIQQIRTTGVPMLLITSDETVEGAFQRVRELGFVVGREEAADEIIQQMMDDLNVAGQVRETLKQKPKVLFIYARGQNNMMVAGKYTSAKTIIELAGGENAFTEFEGYKPLTAEAVVKANPDVILMMNSGIRSVGGKDGVLESPGIELTNAAKQNRIYSMDGSYLLGFGPRLGSAVIDLMQILHPNIDAAKLQSSETDRL